jgi:subfamily B ATP-binding cassette protein MsbA
MLNDSIAANVALGAEPIDRARVQQCLAQANLAEHVAALAQGMDTLVGHNATELSGGQRQRLAIARALYKNARRCCCWTRPPRPWTRTASAWCSRR